LQLGIRFDLFTSMTPSTTRSALLKKTIIGFTALLGGVGVILLFIGLFLLKPLLSERIKTSVVSATDSLYRIEFDHISYNFLTGNATVKNATLRPDTVQYQRLRARTKAPDNLLEVQVPTLHLRGTTAFRLLFSRRLFIEMLQVQDLRLRVIHQSHAYNRVAVSKTPYQAISKFLKSFEVNKMLFDNVAFDYEDRSGTTPQVSSLQKLFVDVSEFKIDSLAHRDSTRFYYSRACQLQLQSLSLDAGVTHRLLVDEVRFSSLGYSLQVGNFRYQPKKTDRAFVQMANGSDRVELAFKSVELKGINFPKLVTQSKLYAQQLLLNEGVIDVFCDASFTARTNKVGQYPHQLFKKLAFKMAIDSVKVQKCFVAYREYNPKTRQTGRITFEQVNGHIIGPSNDSILSNTRLDCRAELHAKVLGKIDLKTFWEFDMRPRSGRFSVRGRAAQAHMPLFNPLLTSLSLTRIETGNMRSFDFSLTGNDQRVTGQGTLIYEGLSVDLMRAEPEIRQRKVLKKRVLLSSLVNKIIIKNNNPTAGEPVRTGQIRYDRPPTYPFFKTIWESLLQALTATVVG
jgi:hypothetical protein